MPKFRAALILLVGAAAAGLPLLAAGPHYSAWGVAQNVGPLVDPVTSDDGNECFTKDGRGLYFVSNRPGGVGRYDIWVTRWDDATAAWGQPVNLGPVVNSPLGDFTPALSRDEHWLFFASNRPGSIGQRDLYASYREHTRDDLGWGPPVNLGPIVNSAQDEFGVTYFENDGTGRPQLYFSSTRAGNFDLYVTELDPAGSFSEPVGIIELSTVSNELTPAIRHDGLELYFSSNRAGGLGGHDIWVSTRDSVFDPWSEPANAGPGVNSSIEEIYPGLAADGTVLVFFRAVFGTVNGTIWTSTRTKIHP